MCLAYTIFAIISITNINSLLHSTNALLYTHEKTRVEYLRSVLLEILSLSTVLDRQYLQLIAKILHIFFLIFSIHVIWYCARFGEYLTTHFFMQTSNLLLLLYKFFFAQCAVWCTHSCNSWLCPQYLNNMLWISFTPYWSTNVSNW